MKRIISLLMLAVMLLCMCACSDKEQQTPPTGGMVGDGSQEGTSPYGPRQEEVIGTLGTTVENSKIIAMESNFDGYVKYIVVRYNEKGEKTGELSYYFCLHDQIYNKMVEENKDNTAVKAYENERYLTIPTNYATNGIYSEDLEILRKDYHIKGQMTPEDYKR